MITCTVTSHFNEVLCRGGFFKCWIYTKLLVPAGWDVVIERAE